MRQTTQREPAGPRWLPIVRSDGDAYFVDNRLRQFRTVTPPLRHIEFIDFESVRGRELLEKCDTLECHECGERLVVPQRMNEHGVTCGRCGTVAPGHGARRPAAGFRRQEKHSE